MATGQSSQQTYEREEEEVHKLSDKLTAFVNILFGVVIGQSVGRYSDLILHPSWTLPFIALTTLYITVILSWAGYHRAILRYPYRYTIVGLGRLFIDIFIVGIYTFLLFEIKMIKELGASASLYSYFIGFFIVYLLYSFFIAFRWVEHRSDKRAKRWKEPVIFTALFFVLLVSYKILVEHFVTNVGRLNWIYIWFPLVLTILYRAVRK